MAEYEEYEHKYIGGTGPLGAKLMVVRECPNQKETAIGHPLLDRDTSEVLREAGIQTDSFWHTYACKFYVASNFSPKNKAPFGTRAQRAGINFQQCIEELQVEINDVKPNAILALGETAQYALTSKSKIGLHRGSILYGMGTKVIPTFRPDHLSWQAQGVEFKGYFNRQIMIFDCKRALAQSRFPELIRPQRILEICKSSAHLQEFYDRWKHKIKVSVDIEASGTMVPVCIGLSFDKSHGISVPLWNCDNISTIPNSDMVQIWILLAYILENHDIVGQNFLGYDKDKIANLGFRIRRLVDDTMMKAFAINPELLVGLAFNTSIFTEEPFYKDDGMYHGSISDLLIGNARDACVTFEVNENMDTDLDELNQRPFYEHFLMQLPPLYNDIQRQGFAINEKERDELVKKYIKWDEAIRYELFKLTGAEINVNSHVQVGTLLWDNFKLPRKESTGEEDLTTLLNTKTIKNETHRRCIELILEGRRVRKTVGTYLMALPDFDGRMRTSYFLCLNTGRTGTRQQEPPIRPTVEVRDEYGKKKDKNLGSAFQTMTKHGDIGADVRGMYVPDNEEEIFVQADSAQAEARVIFLLADDEEALKDIDEHDYHALTASWFFGGTENDYSKKVLGYEHPIRFVGKTLRHAGHLGAGKRRAANTVNSDARRFKIPIVVTENVTERALTIFHTKQPKIQRIFQTQIIEVLKRSRRLIAPIPYGLPNEVKYGGTRTFYERWGDELFRQAFSYLPQRAVSDNTKMAAIRIRVRIPTIKIVMEAHDSLLFSIPISRLNEWVPIIKQEFERAIDFSYCSLPRRELVIPCEIETGRNYRDLSKFKSIPIIASEPEYIQSREKTVTEQFSVIELPEDSNLDNIIYHHNIEKKLLNFESSIEDDDIPF